MYIYIYLTFLLFLVFSVVFNYLNICIFASFSPLVPVIDFWKTNFFEFLFFCQLRYEGAVHSKGCPGAVWMNGNPSAHYCNGGGIDETQNSFRYPWWQECCTFVNNKCQIKTIPTTTATTAAASTGTLKNQLVKCSRLCHYTSCNYRKNYFLWFISLLMSSPQSQLQNKPKHCH